MEEPAGVVKHKLKVQAYRSANRLLRIEERKYRKGRYLLSTLNTFYNTILLTFLSCKNTNKLCSAVQCCYAQ